MTQQSLFPELAPAPQEEMVRTAVISGDGLYRYELTRTWDASKAALCFVMLNPSTADGEVDDRTIGRCIGFARGFGYGGIVVVNLYALRSTKPEGLWRVGDPVGPDNDDYLRSHLAAAYLADQPVVGAWGVNALPGRVAGLLAMPGSETLHCFAITKSGAPKHPLYVLGTTQLRPWAAP